MTKLVNRFHSLVIEHEFCALYPNVSEYVIADPDPAYINRSLTNGRTASCFHRIVLNGN